MISGEVQSNLDLLNLSIAEYVRVSSKSRDEALAHQVGKVQFAIYRGFRGIVPEKGDIRAKARGRGWRVAVREEVKQKVDRELGASGSKTVTVAGRRVRLNRQALRVHRELGLRESGKGYLALMFRRRGWNAFVHFQPSKKSAEKRIVDRYRNTIGMLEMESTEEAVTFRMRDPRPGTAVVEEERQIVADALMAVNQDVQDYLIRKQMNQLKKAVRRNMRRPAR